LLWSTSTALEPSSCAPLKSRWVHGMPGLTSRLKQYLGIAFFALVEALVGIGCIFQWQFLGDNEPGISPTGDNQVTQWMRILFRIGLSSAHGLAFCEELANFEQQLAFCGVFIGSARIRWDIQPNNAQAAGGFDGAHQLVEDHGWLFLA